MGKGTFTDPVQFKDQKFAELKKQCLELKLLFYDASFPSNASSLGGSADTRAISWKRPSDMSETARLFLESAPAPEHIVPGQLSAPWFVSALKIVAAFREIIGKIIPDSSNQEHYSEQDQQYAGIFHCRFWRFGLWTDVVVDDLLPGKKSKLLCTHSSRKNEFWASLVEKAYVKLHGSYGNMAGGHLSQALVDFTGGVCEIVELKAEQNTSEEKLASLFSLLAVELNEKSILCASIPVSGSDYGQRTSIGLYIGHPYCVTSAKRIFLGEARWRDFFKGYEKISMVRLRDPNGPDSNVPANTDKDDNAQTAYSTTQLTRLLSKNPGWSKVEDSEKKRVGLTTDEGEFWMPLEDFATNFKELVICRMPTTNMFALTKIWKETSIRGTWTTGCKGCSSDRAGGSANFKETFLRNPQYLFDIKKTQDMMIQMLQWDSQNWNNQPVAPHITAGFYVIKAEKNRTHHMGKQWSFNPSVITEKPARKKELFLKGTITPGRYIMMPTTLNPGELGGFYIRIFGSSDFKLRPVQTDMPRMKFMGIPYAVPVWATIINVRSAEDLKISKKDRCNGFCKLSCEGVIAKTFVVKGNANPRWDQSFIFYRRKMNKPIKIQVYSHSASYVNVFIGKALLPAMPNQHPNKLEVTLTGKSGKRENTPPPNVGTLILEVYTTDNVLSA